MSFYYIFLFANVAKYDLFMHVLLKIYIESFKCMFLLISYGTLKTYIKYHKNFLVSNNNKSENKFHFIINAFPRILGKCGNQQDRTDNMEYITGN